MANFRLRTAGVTKASGQKKLKLFPSGEISKRKMPVHENQKNAKKYQKMDLTTPRHRCADNIIPQPKNLLHKFHETGKAPVQPKQQVKPFKLTQFKPAGKAPLPEASAIFSRNGLANRQQIKAVRRIPEQPEGYIPFKANPPTVLQKNPFVPKLLEKKITKPEPFRFRTETRCIQRQQFDLRVEQHNLELEAEKRRLAAEKERLEALEIKEMRKVKFHARPVPDSVYHPPPLPVVPEAPLTTPVSPAFLRPSKSQTLPRMGTI